MATTELDTELIDRVWTEAFENGNLDVVDDAVTSDYAAHTPGSVEPIRGAEGFKEYLRMFREAFPDASVTVEDRIVGEDAVVDRYVIRGTHRGEFRGIPATGTEIEVTGTVIHYLADGKVRKDVSEFDSLDLMQQLGVVDAPGE